MNTRLDLLQELAKSRLKFIGNVTMQAVSKSDLTSPEFGLVLMATTSNANATQHWIRYAQECVFEDFDFLHEFCHVKLNEIGFKKVEGTIEQKIELCKSESEKKETNRAAIFIAEAYANSLLFRHFEEESTQLRERLDYSCLMPIPLHAIVQELGYRAIAEAVGYCIAKKWSGFNIETLLLAAFKEAFGTNGVFRTSTELYSMMSELPPIRECHEIQNMTPEDVGSIVECTMKLSKIEKEYCSTR